MLWTSCLPNLQISVDLSKVPNRTEWLRWHYRQFPTGTAVGSSGFNQKLCQVSVHCHFLHSGFAEIKREKKKKKRQDMTILYMSLHHFYLWVVLLSNAALSLFED